jgi:hypothetical protein
LIPIEDYEFDWSQISIADGRSPNDYYGFPLPQTVFTGTAPESYKRFRSLWCLQRRLIPLVPCPENTPLPSRKTTKESRGKILSIYLRPWTLVRKLATDLVPFLSDVALSNATGSAQEAEMLLEPPLQGWRQYIGRVWPHAERGIRSFMLTCLAEGRAGEDEEGTHAAKGPDLVCKLSLDEVHAAVTLRAKAKASSEQSYTEQLVIRTAQQAAALSQLATGHSVPALNAKTPNIANIALRHREIPPHVSAANEVKDDVVDCVIIVHFESEWKARYAEWCQKVSVRGCRTGYSISLGASGRGRGQIGRRCRRRYRRRFVCVCVCLSVCLSV